MVRTQLYLDEAIHARIRTLARRQGRTLSELVREALEKIYGNGDRDDELSTLQAVTGIWKGREDLGDTHGYVRRLRRDTHRLRKRRT